MSDQFTQIENQPGLVSGDKAMLFAVKGRGDAAPRHIMRIATDSITMPAERKRKINPKVIDQLFEDIGTQGLLQPIGVQQHDGKYRVVYGAHRYLAFRRGWEAALKMRAERGEGDQEARRQLMIWESIPCIVFDVGMPAMYAELKEITENLLRAELSTAERQLHITRYAHLVKKTGQVAPADEKRKINASNQHTGKKEGQSQPGTDPQKPTVTEKVTVDLGVSKTELHRSHQKVNDLAQAVARDKGLSAPVKVTAESPPTAEAEHTMRLAELAINDKAKATKEGKDQRKVHAVHPSEPDEIIVRIDITDPEELLAWFEKRLNAASKPLTMKWLRDLHHGLGKMIAEKSVEGNT
jgi:hypothetical protein